jgi:hypothetical protein
VNIHLDTHDSEPGRAHGRPGIGEPESGTALRAGPGPVPIGARRDRRWLHWGAAVLAGDIVVHSTAARLANRWEGWGAEAGNVLFIAISGLLVVGFTYGVVVRRALRSPTQVGRLAGTALGTGVASLASYLIIFTWAPVLIAPGALLLAGEVLRSQPSTRAHRRVALVGAGFGMAAVVVFIWFLVELILTGNFPI